MILDDILEEKRRIVGYNRFRLPLIEVEKQARLALPARGFGQAMRSAKGVACIAEFKRRSPSKGWIKQDADPVAIAAGYAAAGAAALSVLTDTPFFGGSLDDLRCVRNATPLPILRKDFVIDPYQIVEARAAGADAILLILAALRDEDVAVLLGETHRWGMDALVEAHSPEEVARAVSLGAAIIGINHRDLRTFSMDMDLAVRMRPRIPSDRLVVAESGIRCLADVERLREARIDAILVGESLMTSPDPGAALRSLLGAA